MASPTETFIRDGWKCRYCRRRDGLHRHHVVYRSHSGTDELCNSLTLCAWCHRAHHDGFLDITILALLPENLVIKFTRKGNWSP